MLVCKFKLSEVNKSSKNTTFFAKKKEIREKVTIYISERKILLMKILNIYIDETGEFGFNDKSSKLYGISFTFYEQDNDISNEINNLNARLKKIGYHGMIHMADLIMRRGDYVNFDINVRKSIFNAIYQFTKKSPIKIHSIIVNKK